MELAWVCARSLSHVHLRATPGPVAHQAPLSVEFPRQEHWSALPGLPRGVLPSLGLSQRPSRLLHWQAGSLPLVPPWSFNARFSLL